MAGSERIVCGSGVHISQAHGLRSTLSGLNAGASPAEEMLLELQKDEIDAGFPG
jgi:hypothetical protein